MILLDAGRSAEPPQDPSWSPVNRLGVVRLEKPGAALQGARLRITPDPHADIIRHLNPNERVMVVSAGPVDARGDGWLYAVASTGGARGYVASWLIWSPLPDPDARLYWVEQPGIGLQRVVEKEYPDYDIRTGDDARSLVAAVILANDQDPRTRSRVYLDPDKLARAQSPGFWGSALDFADEYRRELRPMLQSVEIKHGVPIWLPGSTYIHTLKDQGIIPTRPEWKNWAIAIGKGIAGFVSGVADGFVSSVIDVFVGIWDLIRTVVSNVRQLISGETLRKAQELYDALIGMSATEVLTMVKEAVGDLAGGLFNDFVDKWCQKNLYEKWYFRGQVVGYILAELLLAVFTGGAAAALKWLPKLGKLGVKLASILTKVLDKVDDTLDLIPGRRRRHRTEADLEPSDGSERARQLPAALSLAAVIAEQHDSMDSPISVVGAALRGLKLRYRWINRFIARHIGPGTYQLSLVASPHRVVDGHYTTTDSDDYGEDDISEVYESLTGQRSQTDYAPDLGPPTTRAIRDTPGVPEGGGSLKEAGDDWFHLRAGGAGKDVRIAAFPKEIAMKMRGLPYDNFDEFRADFWRLVAADPKLSKAFAYYPENIEAMRKGLAPIVPSRQKGADRKEWIAGRRRANRVYQLNHKQALKHGGGLYDLDNIEIVTPQFHQDISQ